MAFHSLMNQQNLYLQWVHQSGSEQLMWYAEIPAMRKLDETNSCKGLCTGLVHNNNKNLKEHSTREIIP